MSSALDSRLERAVAGDGEAFRALIAPRLGTLRVLCRRLTPTEADAQDLLQETLLAAFLGLGRLRAPDRLGGWLHTIAARQALRMRRRAARRALPLVAVDELASNEDLELRVGLRAALAALPPGQRQVAVGRWVAGYRPRELAAALGVPESTVRGRAFQARRSLRVALGARPNTIKEPRMTSAADVVLVFEDMRFGRNMGELPPPLRRFAAFRAAGERGEVRLMVPVADEDAAAIEGAGGELLLELLRFGRVELEQATLEPLAAGA
jgi:RNA polymerase sigma factor (sigma-70 family)